MATLFNKNKIYCNTESDWIYNYSNTLPTTCPNNALHSVNTDSAVVDDILCAYTLNPTSSNNNDNTYHFSALAEFMLCNTSNVAITIELPQVLYNFGTIRICKIAGASNVKILPYGNNLIDGSANKIISTIGSTVILTPNGTDWVSSTNVSLDTGYSINTISNSINNTMLLSSIYNAPYYKYPLIGSTQGNVQLSDGRSPLNGFTSSNNMKYINNSLYISGNSDMYIRNGRNTVSGASGNNLTISAGGPPINSANTSGGNLILKSGIPTGVGGPGPRGSVGNNQQRSNIFFNIPLSDSSGTSDDQFIPTSIYIPVRILQNAISCDILKFDFTGNASVSFQIYINCIVGCTGSANPVVINTGRAVSLRCITTTVTSTVTTMNTDLTQNGSGTPSMTLTVSAGLSTATVRIITANFPTTGLIYSHFSVVVDNLLYNPTYTTLSIPFA